MRASAAAIALAAYCSVAPAQQTASDWVQCLERGGPDADLCIAFAQGLILGYQIHQDMSASERVDFCRPLSVPPSAAIERIRQNLSSAHEVVQGLPVIAGILSTGALIYPCK